MRFILALLILTTPAFAQVKLSPQNVCHTQESPFFDRIEDANLFETLEDCLETPGARELKTSENTPGTVEPVTVEVLESTGRNVSQEALEEGVAPAGALAPRRAEDLWLQPKPDVNPYNTYAWERNYTLLFPVRWIYERSGKEWNPQTVTWRLNDPILQWRPHWQKPVAYNTAAPMMINEDDIGEDVAVPDYNVWLPVQPEYKCEAVLAMQYAIKLHRIQLSTAEHDKFDEMKNTHCVTTWTPPAAAPEEFWR